ncbi:tRNA (N6-threonylcarbamoyladenosine(37)-N6)-methyltransferase TrmO [Polymorphum gilvum]|uniref:YaeB-like protein n=1 Tax=Polymorphum gilvum (strain LMG 25793 / CGMCC 1.9160 / SL003B-26A1) TaxID=991905 RepID=F2J1E9_POLGS|nr:tRNA (N6-threonylcarbamoyladenosine(37)-N6)-methyltransferase TrmO [Polymorphum gilvum]ADZ69731.1 YaeB-like protein [Polymorphum gilvum SL003B-26A1]
MSSDTPRPGEIALPFDPGKQPPDAGLVFIGRIRTPWTDRHACPRNGRDSQDICRIEIDPPYAQGLQSIETCSHLFVLYWMHEARRDLIVQSPAFDSRSHGCFALRTPIRPNPVSLSVVDLLEVAGTTLRVRGLDCLDGTPLIDIKPYFARSDAIADATVGWHGQRTHPGRRSTAI